MAAAGHFGGPPVFGALLPCKVCVSECEVVPAGLSPCWGAVGVGLLRRLLQLCSPPAVAVDGFLCVTAAPVVAVSRLPASAATLFLAGSAALQGPGLLGA